MNDNAKKWIAALRSGEYKQCQNRLQNEDKFCCLGVACMVYEKETGKEAVRGSESGELDGLSLNAQPDVFNWLGLYNDNGDAKKTTLPALIQLNDDGKSFEDIADHIEKYEDEYFA